MQLRGMHTCSNANQVRYLRYMIQRLDRLLGQGEYEKANYILRKLSQRSVSYQNLYKSDGKTWRTTINKALDQLNYVTMFYLVLLLGGAGATVEVAQISGAEETVSHGVAPFVTAVILIMTILIVLRKPCESDLPISGPMTESEYEWLQDTLAYQA